ncbi:hypothetical protein N7532_005322 [Penicillium argentinense]|uniref:Uncharacterized protein n=1 Tax=Penicillium argentinense TaxID=1131581 RepID=A0A9W9FDV2_9EURO|nr:uncharacterized protein N7532_005322 [Penicillium argentinense]KAJ5098321.1 hypothetical protein N7532_005322 [Penicillium argentinense]
MPRFQTIITPADQGWQIRPFNVTLYAANPTPWIHWGAHVDARSRMDGFDPADAEGGRTLTGFK